MGVVSQRDVRRTVLILADVLLENKTLRSLCSVPPTPNQYIISKKKKQKKGMFCVKQRCVPKNFRLLLGFLLHTRSASKRARQRYRQPKTLACVPKLPQHIAGQGYSSAG